MDRCLRDVIGEEAEALVYRFHKLGMEFDTRWDRILGGRADASGLSSLDHTVLVIRICHDLDDLTDYPFSSPARRRRLEDFSHGSIALAEALGRPDVAGLLRRAYSRRQAQGILPEEIQGRHPTGYIVVPKAFRKRIVPAVAEAAHRLWTKGTLRP